VGTKCDITAIRIRERQIGDIFDDLLDAALEQILPILGLSDDREEEGRDAISHLRQISDQDAPEPGRIRSALEKIITIAVAGSAAPAGQAVVSLVH
jgi:hypothetical protein